MPVKKKDLAAELSDKLVRVLETQRALGKESYPLTIQRLVELTDAQASDGLVKKALGKEPFKAQAIVANKKSREAPVALADDLETLAASPLLLEFALDQVCTPASPTCAPKKLTTKVEKRLRASLEASITRRILENTLPPTVGCRREKNRPLLYLTRTPPPPLPPPPEVVLAEKMLQVLLSQRQLGGDCYPLSLQRLCQLTDPAAKSSVVKKAMASVLAGKLLRLDARKEQAPLALAEDKDLLLTSTASLEFLLRANRKKDAHTVAVESLLPRRADLRQALIEAVNRQMDADSLPPSIGWMWIAKRKHVFLMDDVHHGMALARVQKPPPRGLPTNFAAAFDEAFARINLQKGSHNFVSLVDLRPTMPVDRDVFDAELHKLRVAGRYTLSGAEGRHGISSDERGAGIVEDGAFLLYVSRRTP